MIRDAVAQDAAGLAALWNPWIADTTVTFNSILKTADDLAKMIATRQANGHGFLVADSGGLIGFATYAQFRAGIGYAICMEHTIVLAPQARGLGVGRALMAAVEVHAKTRGAHQMIAGICGENSEARAFHAAVGFAEVGLVTQAGFKFGRFFDLVLMQKFLT